MCCLRAAAIRIEVVELRRQEEARRETEQASAQKEESNEASSERLIVPTKNSVQPLHRPFVFNRSMAALIAQSLPRCVKGGFVKVIWMDISKLPYVNETGRCAYCGEPMPPKAGPDEMFCGSDCALLVIAVREEIVN